MTHTGVLQIAVQILADAGHYKTLKRLRKESGDDTLRPENVPSNIRNFNFNALAAGLVAPIDKAIPDTQSTSEAKPDKTSNVVETEESNDNRTVATSVINDTKAKKAAKSNAVPKCDVVETPGRFKRIQDEVWLNRIEKDELKQNSYTMKNDEFSLKAAQELIQVKGKNFRTEKMKKKRASWKGSGEITTHVNSITFDDSD
ncbi:hypothetical protein BaOVIS_002000 [Babesia ovis]|uniref:Srp40 C-terminal domain-containing protein n=1 Tax=Babesia ovis TaxID=5869 RepID=A0A9W5WTH4_BABOV|nr:hypothetical protein BaOVIS_002000 [Babesia ovis]